MRPPRIAMGQIRVVGGDRTGNLSRAIEAIDRANDGDCSLIILPECLDLGWTHPSARTEAETIPGESSEKLGRKAKEAGVEVVAGLVERDGDRIYNSAIWLSRDGEILGKHRKIHILDIARDLYTPGDSLQVFQSGIGPVGMTICADNFPENIHFAKSLAAMGARLIASPCAWAVDADHDPVVEPYGDLWKTAYTDLARAHEATIIGVSNVGPIDEGPWRGRKCIGCSLAVGPGGRILAEGPYGENAESLIVVEL